MNKYKKGFAHVIFIAIGVVVLVVAVGTTYVLIRKTYDPKENIHPFSNSVVSENESWETYKNTEIGIEFIYPPAWKKYEESSSVGYYDWYKNSEDPNNRCINIYFNFFKSEPCPAPRGGTSSDTYGFKNKESIDNLCTTNENQPNVESCKTYKNKNGITIAALSIKDVTNSSGEFFGPFTFYYTYSPNSSRGMSFTAKGADKEVMDKVVDSLRFVPISKSETADWKTYKNEKYGFEFKYPSGNFRPGYSFFANENSGIPLDMHFGAGSLLVFVAQGQGTGCETYPTACQNLKKIKIGDIEADSYEGNGEGGSSARVRFVYNGYLYDFYQPTFVKNEFDIVDIAKTFKPTR